MHIEPGDNLFTHLLHRWHAGDGVMERLVAGPVTVVDQVTVVAFVRHVEDTVELSACACPHAADDQDDRPSDVAGSVPTSDAADRPGPFAESLANPDADASVPDAPTPAPAQGTPADGFGLGAAGLLDVFA
ncbi:MAG: hypothetical protein AAF078_07295 [Planctomycetota bacterium]